MKLLKIMLCYLACSQAYWDGAPGDEDFTMDTVCTDRLPLHINATLQPDSTSPFSISFVSQSCMKGKTVAVFRIDSNEDTLKGFIIQARDKDDKIIGYFDSDHTPNSHLTCQDTSLTQNDKFNSSSIEIKWVGDCEFEGEINIKATLFRRRKWYWRASLNNVVIPAKNTEPCQCQGSFSCSGSGCEVGWYKENSRFHFLIDASVSPDNGYVALGFSEDAKMGNDVVIYCYVDNGAVGHGGGRTIGKSLTSTDNPTYITLEEGKMSSGKLSCHLSSTFEYEPTLDLSTKQYKLFVVIGVRQNGQLNKHDRTYQSAEKIDFSTFSVVQSKPRDKTLLKIHGALMVLAWLFVVPTVIILPKHFKQSDATIFSKPMWFICHQVGMIVAFLFTIISFILIFIYVGGYSAASGWKAFHPPLGIIVTILVIANPTMSLFRCSPTDARRWIFNFMHQLCGIVAHSFAMICLLLAGQMKSAGLPFWWTPLLLFHIAWQIAIDFLFKFFATISEKKNTDDSKTSYEKPKLFVLVSHAIVLFSLSTTFIVGVVLDP